MESRAYLLQALSPLHVGTGQSVGVIDLPLMRMRATGIPIVPGSSLKGVLRDSRKHDSDKARSDAIFGPRREKPGPEGDQPGEYAGALVVGDARLLALPVRGFVGTFAMVTSPLLLALARRDWGGRMGGGEVPGPVAPLAKYQARVASLKNSACLYRHDGQPRVYLEDLDLEVENKDDTVLASWAEVLGRALPSDERDMLMRRLVLVDDETMSFLWETATQVDTRVSINPETGTAAQGQLWTEESLPAETLLMGVMAATRAWHPERKLEAGEVLSEALGGPGTMLQLGGKATVGRGWCRLLSWQSGGSEGRR
ncbi:CRISPR-associated RAMP Cmr4 family protein [Myxococcus stipitatus DSM 14675]|uniref:CRISPR-associated RAMP Cmr4 family protein n=1 Tax=Myxococcus stipitatus (strain DSM 14675 / JCM 12634 / Mx s8) TaxID=1278073 RepID=L7UMT6_MYXSD|nr:type III-B CRISPR module RAMP protein Cmr4 [Myxococcus stipitatus]AGC49205.1 CRISPR-associated RAMP Cmr4 family protein [Myxococcus stipitatus DSM 14675]